MNRIDRLQAILLQIQSKKVITAQEIANRFEISIRTVYRDIRALEEAGVPIGAEAGIGYFLDDNYNLPPVMFTHYEASALLLAGKLLPHMVDKKVEFAFQEALMKVKAIMGTQQKESLEKLENSVRVYSGINHEPVHESIFLQDIQQSLIEQKVVNITYRSHYKQEEVNRDIEPIGLLHYASNWHVIAYCRLRKQYRDFRLDRIKHLLISNDVYTRQLDKAFNEYLNAEKAKTELHEISFVCSPEIFALIENSKYWYGYINSETVESLYRLRFLNPDLKGFARWIVSLGTGISHIQPLALREQVLAMVNCLYNNYLPK